ncbi:MAG: glycerol-3-phosphate dehydrogenase/oxidase [Chloroflexi bacterium]|nr:MAG: glycerol-3-phosphate dehydrogenase/oxidase [Chloroflexota bacterium]MBL1195473.1 glycerol-3-phosphate dehydrogenase/oxidase [Chloroflexota bacterium]NOH12755.1 glycerol-3-phosphate dehydrogenase/oxidase [Chloroflexota bacterium]
MQSSTRKEIIQRLKSSPKISVLIVGAGVNGIGTFRDLALQGVDVLMVDRSDFCSGASAASSHMVHGGIRYLENGEFRLVREAVQERNRLIENAPHLVNPLPTVFPIFKWFSGLLNAPLKFLGLLDRPAERGAIVIKIGMVFYDAFTSRQGTVPSHKFIGRDASLDKFPQLNPDIIFTGTYYDGSMPSPERICMELIADATQASPDALALNYVSLRGADSDVVTLQDELTGDEIVVEPQIVVNAAGPWIDFANQRMGAETQFIGGTKGSHLILDHPELREAIGVHEFFFENEDGRIVLIFPLLDKVMIGASDIRIQDPDQARCTEEEIDYFFGMLARVFPGIVADRSHIVFQFSGVRPLPYKAEGSTGQISRDHSIVDGPSNAPYTFPVLSLVGGKWTSFRAFSEQVTDRVLSFLDRERLMHTRSLAIGGGTGYPKTDSEREAFVSQLAKSYPAQAERCDALFARYGTKAQQVLDFASATQDNLVSDLSDYSQNEIEYLINTEQVAHLDDLLLRRTVIAKLGFLTTVSLEALAGIFGQVRGLSSAELDQELERTKAILADKHGVVI